MTEKIAKKWLIVAPMVHLTVSDDPPIHGRWQVGDVTFFSKGALEERLAEQHPLNPIKRQFLTQGFTSFAVMERGGATEIDKTTAFSELRQAALILAASTAFSITRSDHKGFGIIGDPQLSNKRVICLEKYGEGFDGTLENLGTMISFKLDSIWHQAIVGTRILELFNRITDSNLDADWRRQIRQSAAMLGRSIISLELSDAFLFNVIALETLLTTKGHRNGKSLSRRIKGLTGWQFEGSNVDYERHITDIHNVRCEIVHDSDYRNLTVENLLWADLFLKNCLLNVVVNPNWFTSKDKMAKLVDDFANTNKWPRDGSVTLQWCESNKCLDPTGISLYLY